MLRDKLLGPWTREVDRRTLRADAVAGLLGAVLVLPQGIAFAALAGLPPSFGLATAVLPCIVAALFGSSRHVMSGPTNANSLALFAMLAPIAAVGSPAYIQLAIALTVVVGAMQWAIGALRLGTLAHFISPAALRGFTGGAAVLIAVHALKDWTGLVVPSALSAPAILLTVAERLPAAHVPAVVTGAITIALSLLAKRLWPRSPAMLLGVIGGALFAAGWMRWVPGGSAIDVVGIVPVAWPRWQPPQIDWRQLPELLGLASALTIIALAQSFAVAKSLAARSGQQIDANREFVGQGLSNLVGGFFSCYVSCGSMNRSVPNLEAGAKTPLAAVFSSLWLLLLAALSAPLLAAIPMASIAGLLVLVAVSLFDLPEWRRLWRLSRLEFGIALATLIATLVMRLEVAILAGTVLSLSAYLWRTSRPAMRSMGFDTREPGRPFVIVDDNPAALPECPQLKLLRMEGSVYFGAAQHVGERLHALRSGADHPKHLLVMSKSMNFIDLAGDALWRDELRARRRAGGDLYFHRPRPPVMELWERTGFLDELGRDHVFADKHSAIATIVPKLDPAVCSCCPVKLFHESPAGDPDRSVDRRMSASSGALQSGERSWWSH